MFSRIPFIAASVIFSQSCLSADQLPIADGVYLDNQEQCTLFKKHKLDFLDFVTSKNGRSYSMPQVGCLVASITPVREKRFHVEGDCIEVDELWQHSFFLDVVSPTSIRMDGEDLVLCQSSNAAESPPIPIARPEITSSEQSSSVDDLIERWHEENENCRGGSGDDPETLNACDRRGEHEVALHKLSMCYGTNAQHTYQYEWHRCRKDSIMDPG